MLKLKSVSKPQGGGLELKTMKAPASRKELAGKKGSAPAAVSRAEKSLVAVGKAERLRRSRSTSASALESLIGSDDRQRILETDLLPWRMICALRMSAAGGAGAVGTGWLAGPRTVVTAGHCVHHQGFFGGWASMIEVSAGRDAGNFPFGTVNANRFSALDRWINAADPDFDIGCIHLDQPLGDAVGWFTTGSLTPSELENHMVNISGYPGDRGAGTEQYFHVNRVLSVGERRVYYDVDTMGGQSGSPVWVQEAQGADPIVIGIHAYGIGGTPIDLNITANSAPRIIPEVFDIIAGWVAGDSPGGPGA